MTTTKRSSVKKSPVKQASTSRMQSVNVLMSDVPLQVWVMESLLREFRQLYAIAFFLAETATEGTPNRANILRVLAEALTNGEDIEPRLLPIEDQLYITGASSGSFWLTFATKTKAAYRVLKGIAPVLFIESRDAIVRRTRAETELKELEVVRKKVDIMTELASKVQTINDSEVRKVILEALTGHFSRIQNNQTALEGVNRQTRRKIAANRRTRSKPA